MPTISLPTPGVTPGTAWASELNVAINSINNEVDGRLGPAQLDQSISDLFDTVIPETSAGLSSALNSTVLDGRTVRLPGGATFVVTSDIVVDLPVGGSISLDLNGSTLDFRNGARMRVQVPSVGATPISYKEVTVAAGAIHGTTSFTVPSGSGIEKDDLVTLSCNIEVVPGVPVSYTYTVSDVIGNDIYINGLIKSDITPAQISAAGKTGGVTARFFKTARSVRMFNGAMISSDKSSADVLCVIRGVAYVDVDSITVRNPYRSGFNVEYCGSVNITNTRIYDTGYVSGDQGYNSVPSAPGGLSFGYGVLATNCYIVVVDGMHSYRGWHGVDFARGVTLGVVENSFFYKNAFGVSSHEGNYSMTIRNSRFIGGAGITSRSGELIAIGNELYTSGNGQAITGVNSHQRLLIKGNYIDGHGIGQSSVFVFTASSYPRAMFNSDDSYTEISDNTILNVSSTMNMRVAGRMYVARNYIKAVASSAFDSAFDITIARANERYVVMEDNLFENVGSSYNVVVRDLSAFKFSRNRRVGVASTVGVNAVVGMVSGMSAVEFFDNYAENTYALFRVQGAGTFNVDTLARNFMRNGRVAFSDNPITIKNGIQNFGQVAPAANVTFTNDIGNGTITP